MPAVKRMATKGNRAQVQQHIRRQRALGEQMQGFDRARPIELIVTALVLIAGIACLYFRQ